MPEPSPFAGLREEIRALRAQARALNRRVSADGHKVDIKTIMGRGDDEVREIISEYGGVRFLGKDARRLIGPLVYVLFRGNRALYVGMSKQGAARPFSPGHHALPAMEDDDELTLWPVKTGAEAERLERLLIHRLKPSLNRRMLTAETARLMGVKSALRYREASGG